MKWGAYVEEGKSLFIYFKDRVERSPKFVSFRLLPTGSSAMVNLSTFSKLRWITQLKFDILGRPMRTEKTPLDHDLPGRSSTVGFVQGFCAVLLDDIQDLNGESSSTVRTSIAQRTALVFRAGHHLVCETKCTYPAESASGRTLCGNLPPLPGDGFCQPRLTQVGYLTLGWWTIFAAHWNSIF